jgi:hypothetical protein
MGIIDVFYHGKLRDTVSLEDGIKAPIDFVENIKKKVFESSSEFARISSKPMMVAELRRWQDNLYSVFTHFIPAKDTTGRLGGFVAVTTIIHGVIPSDRKKLFDLYKIVHNKLIDFNVISGNQSIKSDSFDTVKAELNSLSKYFSNAISEQCGEMYDISSIILNKNEENIGQFNPKDINEDCFVESLADAGRAYVSSEFLTITEKKKKEEEQQKTKQKEQKEKEDKVKLKEFADLKNQVLNVKEELKELKKKSEGSNSFTSSINSDSDNRTKIWLRALTVLSLVNLILLCLLFFFVRANLKELRNGDEGKKTIPKTETVTDSQSTNNQTSNVDGTDVDKGQNNQVVNSQDNQVVNQQNDPNAVQERLNQITQSIEGSSGTSNDNAEDQPKFGKTYDVGIGVKCRGKESFKKGDYVAVDDTLDLSLNTSKEGHEFYVSGAHFIGNNKRIVVVDDADFVCVWYCHKDDKDVDFNKQCNHRKYPIQKQ